MDLTRLVSVKNRGTGEAGYTLLDGGIRRNWMPGEIKKNITVDELEKVTYVAGGLSLMNKYLIVNDKEVCEYLGLTTEPEYFYDEAEIRTLLTTGSLDALLDCLDFAPTGVIDLIKKTSVESRLNNMDKREAIKTAIGFDVTRAIENSDFASQAAEHKETERSRRTSPVTSGETPITPPKTYRRV